MGFCVVAFVAICLLSIRNCNKTDEETPVAKGPAWSDTISNSASDAESLKPMESDIERFMARWNIKGLSIAVSRNDSLLYAKGLGWADKEAGVKMNANSIMRIASASKLITAAAIMKLVEQNRLSLDTKIFGDSGILNNRDYTEAIRDQRAKDITIGHLLRHEGGFTLGAGDPMFNTKDIMQVKKLSEVPTNQELTKIVLGRRLGFTPAPDDATLISDICSFPLQ